MFRKALIPAALAALVLPGPAAADVSSDAQAIRAGLARAVAAGWLTRDEAYRHRLTLVRARGVRARVPAPRRYALGAVIHDVARQARRFTRPRALALFAMLETNASHLATRPVPPAGRNVFGRDGVLYRAGWGGLQFHPLGNFGILNSHVTARRAAAAARLGNALADRGLARGRGAIWEYYFYFGGGWPPWTSGMAQAVGAHAFARAGTLLANRRLLRNAFRAYAPIPRSFVMRLSAGPWIRHYSFSGLVVLNSQLQSAHSLGIYARLRRHRAAASLAYRLRLSASRLFPRFDTGYWSRYSLGVESSLHYHVYVGKLLRELAAQTGNGIWTDRARRFERYLRERPRIAPGPRVPILYPVPADGFRDRARIRFWLSKISTVRFSVAGYRRTVTLSGGWHTFFWWPGRIRAGDYRPAVTAVDLAGNRATGTLPAVRVRRSARFRSHSLFEQPPLVSASLVTPAPAPDVDALP